MYITQVDLIFSPDVFFSLLASQEKYSISIMQVHINKIKVCALVTQQARRNTAQHSLEIICFLRANILRLQYYRAAILYVYFTESIITLIKRGRAVIW